MSEEILCFSYLLNKNPKPCSIHCTFYEEGLSCPFRTSRDFWSERGELNLCDYCQQKDHACRFLGTATTDRKTKNVIGCFGFIRKDVKNENKG